MNEAVQAWRGPFGLPSARHTRVWLAAAVIAVGIGYLVATSLQNNAVYYLTVGELQARAATLQGQPVRVAGNVAPGSIERDPSNFTVRFSITDSSGQVPVTYRGVTPDIFGPGIEVVVEGRYGDNGVFTASTLLAKCPSKFEAA